MAKTKPQDRTRKPKRHGKISQSNGAPKKTKASPELLLTQATALLQTSQPNEALICARRALALLQPTPEPTVSSLPAVSLLGEINVELGNVEAARENFTLAASLDPEGEVPGALGGGAEKFLWLAQLCEDGGSESVQWFEKGAMVLRREIGVLEGTGSTPQVSQALEEKKTKLANALCGVVEVYMTDLSWEEDAEARCETLVTEALLVASNTPEPLQTLASVRISQLRMEDARAALSRSIELWKDLDTEDVKVPDFPTRISLSRLLMEAEMEDDALEVLERLVGEDDSSVEAWYLGGWCLYLMSEKRRSSGDSAEERKALMPLMRASREWLQNSLKLYQVLEYEDGRLKEHAEELVQGLTKVLGPPTDGDEADEDKGDWEDDEEGSEDEEMEDT
ncbi:TPR domain-containing protein [Cenococcum geophilum]